MKVTNFSLYSLIFLIPMLCSAGESSKGTVIMISSVSGWLLLSSGFLFWKEIKRNRRDK